MLDDDIDTCADCGCEIGPDTSEDGFRCDDCADAGSDDEYYDDFDRW